MIVPTPNPLPINIKLNFAEHFRLKVHVPMDQNADSHTDNKNLYKKQLSVKKIKNAMGFGTMEAVPTERDVSLDMNRLIGRTEHVS